MKIQLLTKELLPTLQAVINVVEKTHNIPILSHVLINLDSGKLTLTTTNLEIQIKCTKIIECQESCQFTLYAKSLIGIIKDIDEDIVIYFEINKNNIKLNINNNFFELNSFNHQDFPSLTHQDDYSVLKVDAQELKKLINKTSFTIANQDIRVYLNGLYFEANNQKLTLVSTDGYRLSLGSIEQKNNTIDKQTAIIPKKSISEITKLLLESNQSEDIDINLSENHLKINFKDTEIVSQLINGKYPNYQKVIPNTIKDIITLNRQDCLQSLKSIIPLIDENNKSIFLNLEAEELFIKTKSERGKAQASIKVQTKLKSLKVSFNIHFLISALDKLSDEEINISIPDQGSESYLFTNKQDSNYQYIIMPIKV